MAAGILAWAQIVAGQLPPGPSGPPQPGQLAPADSDKPADPKPAATNATAVDDKPTFDQQNKEKPLVTVTTSRVVVSTTVLDPDGHGYVTGLKGSDFKVYDNGKAQKIDADLIEQPVSVLAVQANAEMEGFLPKLKKSANLLHGLVTGVNGDVAILAFDHRMQLLQDFTSDPDKLDDAMQRLRAGSNSSAIIDAVLEGDRMLKRRRQQRE